MEFRYIWRAATYACVVLSGIVASAQPSRCPALTLALDTSAGVINIELYNNAAPGTVQWLTSTPIADTLTFDVAKPNVALYSAPILGADATHGVEINAASLGLHQQTLSTIGDAQAAIQNDLIPAYRRSLDGRSLNETLRDWLARWYQNYDASFLIGTSLSDVHAALGIPDTPGLLSHPVTAGSVALVPADAATVTSKLAFFLSDAPANTGRWPVIGRVTQGLDLLARLSREPRHPRSLAHTSAYVPKAPVSIYAIRHQCAPNEGELK